MASGKYINPNKIDRTANALKAERNHHIITHNPSNINPNETLYVRIPRLTQDTFYVPNSIYLSADITLSGNDKNMVVNNVGRYLIKKFAVKIGSETVFILNDYNLFMNYKDLWLTKAQRKNLVFQGIQSSNLNKLRSSATDANVTNAKDNIMFSIYGNKYKIPLDFELINNNAPLYKHAIQEDLIFEITFAPISDIIISESITNWNYKLSNICLEYDTVTDATIASTIQTRYQQGYSVLYDYIDKFKTVNIAANDEIIHENVNFPRSSIKGILLLFTKTFADGSIQVDKYYNPGITKLEITIEGIANKIFCQSMRMLDQFTEIRKHFMPENLKLTDDCNINLENYYTDDKYALWIDFRTTEDNTLHGSGLRLKNTKDGVQIFMKKKTGEGPYKMHVFIISDSALHITNSQLNSVQL